MKAEIIKVVGSDEDIIKVSRVATAREAKPLKEGHIMQGLKHLIKMRHWSPFEMQHIYLKLDIPIYVARQLMRSPRPFMEKSRRYTKGEVVFEDHESFNGIFEEAGNHYYEALAQGFKPEEARKVLPMGTYTTILWNPNLRNLLHFMDLRLDTHAQQEIRILADSIYHQLFKYFPKTLYWWTQYSLGEFAIELKDLYSIVSLLESETDEDYWKEQLGGFLKDAKARLKLYKEVIDGGIKKV